MAQNFSVRFRAKEGKNAMKIARVKVPLNEALFKSMNQISALSYRACSKNYGRSTLS